MAVTVGILLSLSAIVLQVYGADNHTLVECLQKDQSKEIYVQCPEQSVIRVTNIQFGYQNRPVDDVNSTCIPQDDDECAVQAPHDAMDLLMERCMGQQECQAVIREKYLFPCNKYSNYFQMNYQCILDKTTNKERMIIDVCGDVLGDSTEEFSRPAGYIESLNYPENYSPDTSCTCHLETLQSEDTISLEVLDMSINTSPVLAWSYDWLEYAHSLEEWGEGKRLNTAKPGTVLNLMSNTIYLNFKSDANTETRGFWIKYMGSTQNGSLADVKVSCMVYKPSDYRTDTTCFTAPHHGEMFLNCKSIGVINVLQAQAGSSDDPDCGYVLGDVCSQGTASMDPIRGLCMGKEDCHVVTQSEALNVDNCPAESSNYVQVHYQCVKDALDPANIVDICGDIMGDNEVLSRSTGYIESLNYPNPYSPDTQCYCELSVRDVEWEVILLLLDADVNPGGSEEECGSDWLEYVRGENRWGQGEKVCGKPRSEPIYTGSSRVHLNFNADNQREGRGFWVKYKGSGPGGEPVPVELKCAMYTPPPPVQGTDDTKDSGVSPADKDRGTHQGLIVGLSITAALMLVMLLAMVTFKCKRDKSSTSTVPPGLESSHLATPASYGTLQKFAHLVPTRKPPYSTLDESQPNSLRGKPGYQGSSSYPEYIPPDYPREAGQEVVFSRSPGPSSQYVNPAFDGTLEGGQHSETHQHIKL